jgi:hypothetical protein
MSTIYPYATLPPDATTQFDLHWLNDGSATRASTHTVFYREVGSDTWIEQEGVTGSLMTASSTNYFYYVRIDGLKPDRQYEGEIRVASDVKAFTFQTLPTRLWRRELRVISMQDVHIRRNISGAWNNDVTKMDIVSDENPEVILFAGDWLTSAPSASSTNANKHADWVKNFLQRLDNNGRLVPIFYVPGNHEVGNYFWSGLKLDSLDDNAQLNDFCLNKSRFEPFDEYYGQISIGNYVNFVGLDTHAAYIEDQTDWMFNNLNRSKPISLSMSHNPILIVGNRESGSLGINTSSQSDNQAEYWIEPLYSAGNIQVNFSGNIHVRKATKGVKVSDTGGEDTIPLQNEKYAVLANEGERSLIELGEGWASDKELLRGDSWYVDYASTGQEHYYRILLRQDGYDVTDIRLSDDDDEFEFQAARTSVITRKSLMV